VRTSLHTGLLASAALFACGLMVVASPAVPAVASGQVCAAVVIDDGNGVAPAPQSAQIQPGANDLDLLNAANDSFTQNSAGLVCAIDGYPANGLQNCLGTANGLFYYWSYWQGDPSTNTWTYAQIGPAEHTVAAGQTYVEGWRYQNPGPDSPSAAPPSVKPTAAFTGACASENSVPASGGGGGGSAAGAGGGVPSPAGSGPERVGPSSPAPSGTGTAAGGTAPTSGVAGAAPGATTTTTGGTSVPSQQHAGRTTPTSARSSPRGTQPKSKTTPSNLALSRAAAAHRGSGGNPALPIILIAVLIGLLGAGAWLRWRRRPAEE
jgi:hypothetical protein